MPKFYVSVNITNTVVVQYSYAVTIDADDEDEAGDLAIEAISDDPDAYFTDSQDLETDDEGEYVVDMITELPPRRAAEYTTKGQ